jgi:hypothetical protein
MIAWKASARRDRLMTKEFESEVPIRCTLFVDTSHSVRVGPPGQNALTRLVEIASAAAQASAGARDLTGLVLFDEATFQHVRPGRGPRHLMRLLNLLTDAAGLAPATGQASVEALLPLAYGFTQEVYPEFLEPDLNAFPWWLPWVSPPPAYTKPRPTLADRLFRRLPFLLAAHVAAAAALLVGGIRLALRMTESVDRWFLGAITVILVLAVLVIPPALYFPERRRRYRWRKELAAVLSVHFGLGPGGLAILLEDDRRFAELTQRFLAEHQVPYPLPLYDDRGHYLFASPGKVELLAAALLRAVGQGHDNELFVLMTDLLELGDHLQPLLRAVKAARARHHHVIVICPWPPGIPPPSKEVQSVRLPSQRRPGWLRALLLAATTDRFVRAYHQLRRTFARLGVPVLCAQGGDPVRVILQRLERLRTQERGRR